MTGGKQGYFFKFHFTFKQKIWNSLWYSSNFSSNLFDKLKCYHKFKVTVHTCKWTYGDGGGGLGEGGLNGVLLICLLITAGASWWQFSCYRSRKGLHSVWRWTEIWRWQGVKIIIGHLMCWLLFKRMMLIVHAWLTSCFLRL